MASQEPELRGAAGRWALPKAILQMAEQARTRHQLRVCGTVASRTVFTGGLAQGLCFWVALAEKEHFWLASEVRN